MPNLVSGNGSMLLRGAVNALAFFELWAQGDSTRKIHTVGYI